MSLVEDYCYDVFDSVMDRSWNAYGGTILKLVGEWLEADKPDLSGWDTDMEKSASVHKRLGEVVDGFMHTNKDSLEVIYLDAVREKLMDEKFAVSILEEAGVVKTINATRSFGLLLGNPDLPLSEAAAAVVREEYSYGDDDYVASFENYILESEEWEVMVKRNMAKYFDVKITRYGQEIAEFTKIKALSEEEALNQAFLGLEMQLSTKVTVSEDW